jgi:hypothetical protein
LNPDEFARLMRGLTAPLRALASPPAMPLPVKSERLNRRSVYSV